MVNKRQLRIVLLGVALAGTMASCQKDEMKNDILVYHGMSQKSLAHQNPKLSYWIDGVEYSRNFVSKDELNEFISYLIGLTLEGREITIGGSENPSLAPEASDKVTFKTFDKAEMDIWAKDMRSKGYDVTVTFDKGTGLYTGTATNGGSRTTMATNLSEERE